MPFIVTRRKPVIKLSTWIMQTFAMLEQQRILLTEMSPSQLEKQLNTVLPKYQAYPQTQAFITFSYNRMIKKWFCFQSPLLSGVLRLYRMKANTGSKHGATVTATTPTEILLSGQTGLQVCVPSTPTQTNSESLQRYVCVQKLTTNFLKTQNALKSLKFELLRLWCLNYKLEYLWVLTLPGTKKGFLVQISFSVLAIKMKGDLGLTKKPSSSLVVSPVQSFKPKFWTFSIFAFAVLRQKKMFTTSHLVLDVTKNPQTTNQQKQINKQTPLKGASQVF